MVISHIDKDQVGIPFVGEYEVDSLYEQNKEIFSRRSKSLLYGLGK